MVSTVDVGNFWGSKNLSNAVVGWQGQNESTNIGLYVTCFKLANQPLKKIEFNSFNKSVWMIVGATVADQYIAPQIQDPLVYKADEDWLPLPLSKDNRIEKDSALDFSFLHDAPSGKYGFLQAQGENFVFEKQPEKPFRFYGVNLCMDVHYMEDEYMNKMLDDIAAMGYNVVRFHHFDQMLAKTVGRSTTSLLDNKMERLDALLAGCKKRGLYVTFDFFTCRKLAKGEISDFPDIAVGYAIKPLYFINEEARKNIDTFASNILNHVNPYTNLAWKDDPTIITISYINEDTPHATINRYPWVKKLYDAKFEEWLKEQNITKKLNSKERNDLWNKFIIALYNQGFDHMRKFLKEHNVKVPFTDVNFWSNIQTTLLRENLDFVDTHFYNGHPMFLGANWQLPIQVANGCATTNSTSGVFGLFNARLLNKPFTVTEWDYVNPNQYNVEGAFLVGAYSALQNWSGLCRFAYAHGSRRIKANNWTIGTFDICNDPLRQFSERAGALFFLRQDVQEAQGLYPFILDSNHFDNSDAADSFPPAINKIGLIGKVGTYITNQPITLPDNTKAVITTRNYQPKITNNVVKVNGDNSTDAIELLLKKGLIPANAYDSKQRSFTSDTGQIKLNNSKGIFEVKTPYSEGFVLPENQQGNGNFAIIKNKNTFAAFLVASLDHKELDKSERLLLLHLTDTKNTDMTFENASGDVLKSYGKLPLLIRRGEAKVVLNSQFNGYKLYALDFNGRRIKELPMKRENSKSSFTMKTKLDDKNIVAAYELIKNI